MLTSHPQRVTTIQHGKADWSKVKDLGIIQKTRIDTENAFSLNQFGSNYDCWGRSEAINSWLVSTKVPKRLFSTFYILFSQEMTLNNPKKVYNYFPVMFNTSYKLLNIKMLYKNTRVRDKKRLEKVGNLVKNSYLYR